MKYFYGKFKNILIHDFDLLIWKSNIFKLLKKLILSVLKSCLIHVLWSINFYILIFNLAIEDSSNFLAVPLNFYIHRSSVIVNIWNLALDKDILDKD